MTDFARAVKWDCLPYMVGEGLDIGCGDSRFFDWAVGVDIKPGSSTKGPNQLRDARKLEGYFASESQGFIFSSYLLNELDDWSGVLSSWWKLLRPDGYLILFLPVVEAKEGQKECGPKLVVDAMQGCKPWQFVEARINGDAFFHVYRKCDKPTDLTVVDPDKICAVVKLGAHGDALWASSIFPHLKEQGYYTLLYCQETTEEVLRHDPHIDRIIRFESRLPMGELGEMFAWMERKYKNSRILIECVEGTLLPSPAKIQYHFPKEMRHKLMNFNYVEMHHMQAQVPMEPRVKFYPNDEEMAWANEMRNRLQPYVVVIVPNGSSVSKMWPYAGDFARRLLAKREDVSVVMLGDERGCNFDEHERFLKIGLAWDVRKAMTFCQLANVVIGQETGLLNCVSHEPEVRKVALMSHSSQENLTRDWPNTVTLREFPECAGASGCHRLHYDWQYCFKDSVTGAAKCQAMISVTKVMRAIEPVFGEVANLILDKEDVQKLHVA